jgi:hypothetical protein
MFLVPGSSLTYFERKLGYLRKMLLSLIALLASLRKCSDLEMNSIVGLAFVFDLPIIYSEKVNGSLLGT